MPAQGLAIQTASFPLGRGIANRSDPLTEPPPSLALLENAVFSTDRRLTKRAGYRPLGRRVVGRSAPLSDVQAEMTYGDELVACDRERLYSYDPAEDAWIDKGHLQSVYCTQQTVIRDNVTQTQQDEATHSSGLKVSAWEQEGGARYAVINANTGQTIRASTLIGATATKPKTVVIGNFVVVVWYDTASHLVRAATVATANPTMALVPVSLTSDLGDDSAIDQTLPNFDVCVALTMAGQQMYLAFNNAAGGTSIWRFLANNPTVVISTIARPLDPSVVINVFADKYAGAPVLFWYDGTEVWFAAYDANLTTVLGDGLILSMGSLPFTTPINPVIKSLTGVSVSSEAVDLVFFGTIGDHTVQAPRFVADDPMQNLVWVASVSGGSEMSLLSYMVGTPWMERIAYALSGTATLGGQTTLLSYMVGTPMSDGGDTPDGGAVVLKRACDLATKAFDYNGRAYVTVAYQSIKSIDSATISAQNVYVTLDEYGAEVTKLLPGLGGGFPVGSLGQPNLAEVSNVSDTARRFALLATDQLVIAYSEAFVALTPGSSDSLTVQNQTGVASYALDFFNPTNSYLRAECGRTLNIGGGFISMYDGLTPVELGFHVSPEQVFATDVDTVPYPDTGNPVGLGAGIYTYVACYEWQDNQGQTHRSRPSVIRQITLVTGAYPGHPTVPFVYAVTLGVNTLHLTQKQNVRIGFYRTVGSAQGTTFINVGYADNDPDAFYVEFIDTLPDSQLGPQPLLYAQPDGSGEFTNVPPGPCTSLAAYANRLIALSSVDTNKVWFSKQCQATDSSAIGSPVEFSRSFYIQCNPEGGDITAVASVLDDKLAFLKRYSVYYVTGQGPAANGTNYDFSIPTLATTACGCSNPRSVTSTPMGLLFQTDKGYWQVGRDMVATFLGADANNYSGQRVTSGYTIPNTTQMRLTLAPTDANPTPTALMYDYYAGQWGTFTNIGAVDATLWRGQYVWMRSDGTAFVETPGSFTDAGAFIKLRLTTTWFRMAGLEGFQKIWKVLLLGTFRTAHTLRVRFAYDNNPYFVQDAEKEVTGPRPWGSDSAWGGGAVGDSTVWGGEFPAYEWDLRPAHQTCEAIKLTIEDAPLTGYPFGESASFSVLTMEYGATQGASRRPATAQIG